VDYRPYSFDLSTDAGGHPLRQTLLIALSNFAHSIGRPDNCPND
jgi:hypothetical protein